MTKSNNYSERIKKLQQSLHSDAVDAVLIENPYDLFYLTGLHLSLGHLFVQQRKSRLFVDGRYFEAAKKHSPVPVEDLKDEHELAFLKGVKQLAFNGDRLMYSGATSLRKMGRKGKFKLLSRPDLISNLRLIKDASEIRKMRKSAQFIFAAYERLKKKLKPGVTEIELAKALEVDCLMHGAEKMSFEPIIAFGKNTSLPHHHPGKTKLKVSDIVLFGLGVVLDGYCSDMTRVDFVGKVDPKLEHLRDVNRAAQKVALAKCKPGVRLKELDLAARRVMASAGLEEYFIHSLGHGVGLEVHESPRISKQGVDRNMKLEAGMVITIEPGLYLPGKGGVRYEDTVVITPNGYTNLYPES